MASDICPVTGRTWHLHKNAPPTPCPCGYTFSWNPPRGGGSASFVSREKAERLVAAALREDHCSTKQKARIIVVVTPEAAAETAVRALSDAGAL